MVLHHRSGIFLKHECASLYTNIGNIHCTNNGHTHCANNNNTNVLVELEHGVHENVVAKPNMDDDVQDDGNQMDVNNVQLSASHIHPLPNNVPPPMLPTPSRQPIKTRPPIPVPHGEGMPNIVADPSPLQGRPSYPVGG